ncbi:MAG: lycopene cyclase domain-containing protein [Bacteroidia bacterium]
MSLYAWLMLASFVGPFALSFDKKVAFYKWFKPLFIGISINAILFILWDGWFTRSNIWWFNNDYVWPFRINDLPIEEWLFFVVVPYASVFIYACIKAYFSDKFFKPIVTAINYTFIVLLLLACILFYTKTYTLVNCALALALLLWHQLYLKKSYMAYFWMAYVVHLIPFLLVNGVLTGLVTPEPVVGYNSNEIIGLRIFTIPIEDTIYALTCLIIPITVLEYFKAKNK